MINILSLGELQLCGPEKRHSILDANAAVCTAEIALEDKRRCLHSLTKCTHTHDSRMTMATHAVLHSLESDVAEMLFLFAMMAAARPEAGEIPRYKQLLQPAKADEPKLYAQQKRRSRSNADAYIASRICI